MAPIHSKESEQSESSRAEVLNSRIRLQVSLGTPGLLCPSITCHGLMGIFISPSQCVGNGSLQLTQQPLSLHPPPTAPSVQSSTLTSLSSPSPSPGMFILCFVSLGNIRFILPLGLSCCPLNNTVLQVSLTFGASEFT